MKPLSQPNVVVFLVDNLGFGELGCYGGGVLRGAVTPHVDGFAAEGVSLTNFAPEAQCTPSRSALLTGRFAIRSGTSRVPMDGTTDYGLVSWERTMAQELSESGYATALYGKWHLGESTGRWPGDHGFEHWYGPPRTYDECLWSEDPFYDPDRDEVPFMLEARAGTPPHEVERLTLAHRRDVDLEFERRSFDFIDRAVAEERPFFLLYSHSMMHLPTVPREEFVGMSESGSWGDSLMQLDHDFGSLLSKLSQCGVADDTIVVFVGDNGAEDTAPWAGTSGFFNGSYFTGNEGSLRTPCIIRWPGTVPSGAVSNGLFHMVDLFPTLLQWCGIAPPTDRVLDGIDQRAFLESVELGSAREGFPFWSGDVLYGAKWRDWKLTYYEQKGMWDPILKLALPKLVNLLVDPKELENVAIHHTWVWRHLGKIIREFHDSVEVEELIPYGAPVDFVPGGRSR